MSLASAGRTVAFLYTTDVARCLDWYERTLDLRVRGRDDYGAFLESGEALVRVTAMPGFKAGEHPVLGWDVEDIRATVAELVERGVTFAIYEGMGQDISGIWSAPDGSAALAWFSDPDGNVLSLSQG